MAQDYTICIGTVGQGLWHSPDGGETWQRMRQPFPLESRVRALALHPTEAHTLFAGADSGLYRSSDNGASWERVSVPEASLNVWSLALSPPTRRPSSPVQALRPCTDSGMGATTGSSCPWIWPKSVPLARRGSPRPWSTQTMHASSGSGSRLTGCIVAWTAATPGNASPGGSPIPTSTAWSSRGASPPACSRARRARSLSALTWVRAGSGCTSPSTSPLHTAVGLRSNLMTPR